MKISKLYSNQEKIFNPIEFQEGLNIVLAEIRLPQNKKKDTHNLGKSLLGKLLDFMLLKGADKSFFLLKHKDIFENFVFYLEIELLDSSFLTIRRSVESPSKASFKRHINRYQNYIDLPDAGWDHCDLPYQKAVDCLDAALNLGDFTPSPQWTYRKGISYFLRSQDDYRHVFQLSKFLGKHSDWKPFIAHLLGLDTQTIFDFYEVEEKLDDQKKAELEAKIQFGENLKDSSSVDNLLLIKNDECKKSQALIDKLDFKEVDKENIKLLVEEYDVNIASLNNDLYRTKQGIKKINLSLDDTEIKFNVGETEKLFEEAGSFFGGQIKKDFEQLICFKKAISSERAVYLKEERAELELSLQELDTALDEQRNERKKALAFLSSTDIFDKYKEASNKLTELKMEIALLNKLKETAEKLKSLSETGKDLVTKKNALQAEIQKKIDLLSEDPESTLSKIRLFFNDIIQRVINKNATLDVFLNKYGHLEFEAQLRDKKNAQSSAAEGTTYKKLMCVAFDMALLKANLSKKFPRFVFHDGIFETLDDRKKIELLNVLREYIDLDIQSIITTIDSDLPDKSEYKEPLFSTEEVVLLLHDEGDSGRIFKMSAW